MNVELPYEDRINQAYHACTDVNNVYYPLSETAILDAATLFNVDFSDLKEFCIEHGIYVR